MYSIKEKTKLLRELHNPSHAEADLKLLREVSPQNDLLKSPLSKAAQRFAERILYTLLDHTTADKIRLNRRASDNNIKPEANPDETSDNNNQDPPEKHETGSAEPTTNPEGSNQINTDGSPSETDVKKIVDESQKTLGGTHPEKEGIESTLEETEAILEQTQEELETVKTDAEQRIDELQQTLDETISEKEDVETELEETETVLEQTQEELETIKTELEEEKKSPPKQDPPKSRKKTNTPTSTGKTSSRKTSK